MSLISPVAPPHADSVARNRYVQTWWCAAALSCMLLAAYWPTIAQTVTLLLSSEDMAHGLFAPLVAGYIVWSTWRPALSAPSMPSRFGLFVLLAAALIGVAGAIGGSTTISRIALLISLAGCILLLGGARALKTFSFPLCLLLFTFPLPAVLYGEVTQPLQLLATKMSEAAFEILGFSVVRDGNILELPHQRLSVVEACSGIRSLITLSFFCITYVYFFEPRIWLRFVISLLAVPAAILLNAGRITATGVLGAYAPRYTHGIYHEILGWLALIGGFALVFLVHRIVQRVLSSRQRA